MKMSEKWYDILSFIGKIVLPALATLTMALFKIWCPESELGAMLGATIMAIDTFLNALLGLSSTNYYKEKAEGPKLEEHEAV